MGTDKPNKLYIPPSDPIGRTPFENDLFERAQLASRIQGYLGRISDGCVIEIDAAWGEGKTWFGKNLDFYLRENGHKTVFIDAFENDYVDDAFILITSELLKLINPDSTEGKALISTGKAIASNLLPITAKISLNLLGQYLLGKAGLGDSASDAMGDIADSAEKWIEDGLKHSEMQKKSREDFKASLIAFTKVQSKPVIVFIDELDRCKPTFAVQVIERIKHLFNAQNLIFVLLLNREQMEAAIRGVYGDAIDASEYLGKFVQFSLTLPKKIRNPLDRRDFNREFSVEQAKRYGLLDIKEISAFVDDFSFLATIFELSYRDIERAFILYAMTAPNVRGIPSALAWLIFLKLKHTEIFIRVARNESTAHQEAAKVLLDNNNRITGTSLSNMSVVMRGLHTASSTPNGFEVMASETIRALVNYPNWSSISDRIIPAICEQIDLAIQK